MKFIKMECDKCGASLEMDLDNMQAYCPYCGSKLMIDPEKLGQILESYQETKRTQIKEEEQTKRKEMELQHKEQETKSSNRTYLIAVIIFFTVFIALVIIAEYSSAQFFGH